MEGNPAAGWYADPHEAGNLRYWDGAAWTSHTCVPVAKAVATPPGTDPWPANGPIGRPPRASGTTGTSGTWLYGPTGPTGSTSRTGAAGTGRSSLPTDPWQEALGKAEPWKPEGKRPASWQYAGWFSRFGAAFADLVLLVVVYFALFEIVGIAGGSKVVLFAGFALVVFVDPIWMLARSGQTPGMRFVTLRCVEANTGLYPIGVGRSLLRFVVSFLFGLVPFLPILDHLWPLWDPRKQTLHDKVAGTVVVRDD